LIGGLNIKDFIRNGGGYIGICGGAYFASEKVIRPGVGEKLDAAWLINKKLFKNVKNKFP